MISKLSKPFDKKPALSFTPDFIAQNIQDINFAKLNDYGIKACLIDLDGTVVYRRQYEVQKDIISALKKSGMKIYIATNRPKGRDLKNLAHDLGATGVIHPHMFFGKPFKRYFINGMNDKDLVRNEVVMIGDRYVQDISGANRAGIFSLLVRKLDKPVGRIDKLISTAERVYTDKISAKYFK